MANGDIPFKMKKGFHPVMPSSSDKIEEMDRQVEAEFVEEVRDILSGLEVLIGNLRSNSAPVKESLSRLQRDMLNVQCAVRPWTSRWSPSWRTVSANISPI